MKTTLLYTALVLLIWGCDNGRIQELAAGEAGTYRIIFHPHSPFFHRVELEVELGEGHHHIPLLVSSYACATYRGS